jgi:CubicO group peptidase (beta-lactamase class C family)
MNEVMTVSNSDLVIGGGNKSHWSRADYRRHGFHNLHRIARYCTSFRAAQVMTLEKRMDLRIAELDTVRYFTSLPWFSAMVVIRGQAILFERYAADFGSNCPHSVQSITKTTMNLMAGHLLDRGILDVSHKVKHYLPEIGSGYADATVQQLLNMDVVNEYSQDFADPRSAYYSHEEAMGWRLPHDPNHEDTQHGFVGRVASSDTTNRSGYAQYKDANTEALGWLVERASGRPLRQFLADITDAAGIEGAFHMTTDREGVPTLSGGACLTARDLARYLAIFVRRGHGVRGEVVGSSSFIEQTLSSGVPMPAPFDGIRYSNHTYVSGSSLGHGGWGGQYALANLETGTIGVFFSVVENEHGSIRDYLVPVIRMLESVTA